MKLENELNINYAKRVKNMKKNHTKKKKGKQEKQRANIFQLKGLTEYSSQRH